VGVYYVCMARQMGVRSVAVEPVPINVETLNRNIAINKWTTDVVVHPVACGSASGSAVIFGEGSGASFVSGWARNPKGLNHTVPVERLDDLLAHENVTSKSVFLVDVEGFEIEVLLGAAMTISSPDRLLWILESGLTDHRPEGGMNTEFPKVLELIFAHDYRVFSARDTDFEITLDFVRDCISDGVDRLGTHNFLLVPKGYDISAIVGKHS
jgi:FkbM family methyltransferase